jgi:hypothetical protein
MFLTFFDIVGPIATEVARENVPRTSDFEALQDDHHTSGLPDMPAMPRLAHVAARVSPLASIFSNDAVHLTTGFRRPPCVYPKELLNPLCVIRVIGESSRFRR